MYTSMFRVAVCALAAAVVSGAAYAGPVTYAKDIAPILNERCITCHRPGQIAPMSLMTYAEVRPWVKSIRKNVADKSMPPWHATAHIGEFVNDRSLDPSEIDAILAWADQGAPRGNPKDMPPTPEFPDSEWRLGEPDFVVNLPEVEIPADGPDIFKNLPGTVRLPEDRWVKAIEVLPGNGKVAHHVLVFQVKGFGVDPMGGWLGAWAAGAEPMVFPEGTGRIMRKGANLIGDMHYHPTGTPETDRTRIGLHFADNEDIEKELINTWVINERFNIPAGDPNHEVRASHTVTQDGFIMAFAPHMHYRGKDFKYTARYPDGRTQELLRVDNYDFNWQTNYTLKERFPVEKGTVIECVAHFDNSADNPANPDSTIDVDFGEESYDEMMIGFFDFIVAEGIRPKSMSEMRADLRAEFLTEYAADVYGLYSDDRSDASPLYLPRSGDGRIYLRINNNLTELHIRDLAWSGDRFTSTIAIDGVGDTAFEGTVNAVTGDVKAKLTLPEGRKIPLKAYRLHDEATHAS